MEIFITILVWVIAIQHIGFLYLEMFLWTKDKGRKVFGLSKQDAETTKVLAGNQGLYNGFLSAGLIWGLLHPNAGVGIQVLLFFLALIVIAGVYGGLTAKRSILFIQGLPALIALVFTFYVYNSSGIHPEYKLVSMGKAEESLYGKSGNLLGIDILREYKVGWLTCYTPDSDTDELFLCFKEKGKMTFFLTKNDISIPLSDNTVLMLSDDDKNYEYDRLNYDIKGQDGSIAGIVFDKNLDGQADLRYHFKDKNEEVFVDGEWMPSIRTEKVKRENGKKAFIVLRDGYKNRVVWNGQAYVFQSE